MNRLQLVNNAGNRYSKIIGKQRAIAIGTPISSPMCFLKPAHNSVDQHRPSNAEARGGKGNSRLSWNHTRIISLAEVDGVKAFVIPFNVEFGTLLAFSKLRYSGSLFPRSHPMMPVAPGMNTKAISHRYIKVDSASNGKAKLIKTASCSFHVFLFADLARRLASSMKISVSTRS